MRQRLETSALCENLDFVIEISNVLEEIEENRLEDDHESLVEALTTAARLFSSKQFSVESGRSFFFLFSFSPLF
jgi:hypothetical protein